MQILPEWIFRFGKIRIGRVAVTDRALEHTVDDARAVAHPELPQPGHADHFALEVDIAVLCGRLSVVPVLPVEAVENGTHVHVPKVRHRFHAREAHARARLLVLEQIHERVREVEAHCAHHRKCDFIKSLA